MVLSTVNLGPPELDKIKNLQPVLQAGGVILGLRKPLSVCYLCEDGYESPPNRVELKGMKFEDIIARMEPLLEQLQNSAPRNAPSYRGLPGKGIYVFYEQGIPMYVGRVGSTSKQTMRDRIRQHTIPSAEHNQAVFAFRLLQERLGVTTGHGAELSRPELAKKYAVEFKEMKERVRNMEVRAVEIQDSVTQTVFEIYASLSLNTTRYNNFDTH